MQVRGHVGDEDDAAAMMRLRRDLRGLVGLEFVQRAVAIGALVAIAIRAAVITEDSRTAMVITIVVVLALAYLALAFRIRLGADLLRRDLAVLETREEVRRDRAGFPVDGSAGCQPYRSASVHGSVLPIAMGRDRWGLAAFAAIAILGLAIAWTVTTVGMILIN